MYSCTYGNGATLIFQSIGPGIWTYVCTFLRSIGYQIFKDMGLCSCALACRSSAIRHIRCIQMHDAKCPEAMHLWLIQEKSSLERRLVRGREETSKGQIKIQSVAILFSLCPGLFSPGPHLAL